jgi:hypothetical protein
MSDQMDLIDLARDIAIRQVDLNANEAWRDAAFNVGVSIAKRQSTMLSEDIAAEIPAWITTHEKRAMGAVMKRLQRTGFISPMNSYVKSPSPVGHGRPSLVWASLVFGREAA